MAALTHDFDPDFLRRPWKLWATAVMLAGFGGIGSIWLALDGHKVKMQEMVYAERQALLTRLGEETTALQSQIAAQQAQAAAIEDRLAHARRELSEGHRQ